MRYNTTVKYEGKSATFKTTNKLLEGTYELPEFLKTVRETRKHTMQQTHLVTDFLTQDCTEFENGKQRIPKLYLECFARAYGLPMKLKQLGFDPKTETKSKLAQRLKELRIENSLPQVIVAAELGIARSTYACYESGKNEPDVYTLVKIADYYRVSLDYLVGRL